MYSKEARGDITGSEWCNRDDHVHAVKLLQHHAGIHQACLMLHVPYFVSRLFLKALWWDKMGSELLELAAPSLAACLVKIS